MVVWNCRSVQCLQVTTSSGRCFSALPINSLVAYRGETKRSNVSFTGIGWPRVNTHRNNYKYMPLIYWQSNVRYKSEDTHGSSEDIAMTGMIDGSIQAESVRFTLAVEGEEQPQVRSDGANVQEEFCWIKKRIEANETRIAAIQEKVVVIQDEVEELTGILAAWRDVSKRNDLFTNSNEASVIEIVGSFPTLGKQQEELAKRKIKQQDYVSELWGVIWSLRGENKKLQLQIENLSIDERIPSTSSESDHIKSGIVYIEDKCKITIRGSDASDIGLLTKNDERFQLKGTTKTWNLSEDTWSILNTDSSEKEFLDKLLERVPSLDKFFVRNAWHVLNDHYDLLAYPLPGEMFFQQCIYTPFSRLLVAAGCMGRSISLYYANQDVKSSMSIIRKRSESDKACEEAILCIQPDAVATLAPQWDGFGMIEMKNSDPDDLRADLLDYDKCVLMTAVTATVIKECVSEQDYDKVRLPFIIANGNVASLYVTVLDKNGNPAVCLVGFPNDTRGICYQMYKSPSEERTKLFVAFAVLLNDFKSFFEETARVKYDEKIKIRAVESLRLSTYNPTSGGRRKVGSGNKNDDSDQASTRPGLSVGASPEQCAQEAAQCGGKFLDLRYPFDKYLYLTDSGTRPHDQTVSPFFFRGRSTEYPTLGVTPNQEVFLKVWMTDDVDTASVYSEWMHHSRAFKAGVPVATPLLSELAVSTCSYGTEYLVFAVEFLNFDNIETRADLWHFCLSLIKTVLTLHQKARMLHCDLKPANVRWSNGIVRLVDFEHAQDIANPTWAPGTDGYQAPEILDELPCSTMTDAFSVGRIISVMTGDVLGAEGKLPSKHDQIPIILNEISLKLTDSDPDQRWTLECALHAMQSYSPVNEEKLY